MFRYKWVKLKCLKTFLCENSVITVPSFRFSLSCLIELLPVTRLSKHWWWPPQPRFNTSFFLKNYEKTSQCQAQHLRKTILSQSSQFRTKYVFLPNMFSTNPNSEETQRFWLLLNFNADNIWHKMFLDWWFIKIVCLTLGGGHYLTQPTLSLNWNFH